ncbi:MAG: S9 family peptidase [Acidimicrobiia bacterium]|nr:S9 family peptidase [Acidimicrobiia bacterium]
MRRTRHAWMAALALTAAGCTQPAAPPAAAPAPVDIERVLDIRQAGAPFWSPDGASVGFFWTRGTEREMWAADPRAAAPGAPGEAAVRQVAPLAGRASAVVSGDWSAMAYVDGRHIWRVPLDGGAPQKLTTTERRYTSLNWSPDGTRIAFVSEEKDQTDVGVVSAAGGDDRLIARDEVDEDSPIWAPDSRRLAFQRRTMDWSGYEIRVADVESGRAEVIATEHYERGVEEFVFEGNGHWSPDGTRIVYLSSRAGYNHLWIAHADGRAPTPLTSGAFVDYSPVWSPAGDRIAFVSSRVRDLEERHIWVVAASGGDPVRVSPDGFASNPAWSADGTRLSYLRSSATEPPEVTVVTPGETSARRLTESRPSPEATANFYTPTAVRWPSRDGMDVPGVILRAPDAPGNGPALLWFHGKGGINLTGWGGLPHYAFHQRLAQQGYTILFVNWRGTHIGYGAEFERANYQDYAGGELDDVVTGAEYLVREYGVDPKRIAAWGGSYGGYMTMLALAKSPETFSAGVSLYGVSDWDVFLDQSQRKLWRLRLIAKLGDPRQNPAFYERSAAIRDAARVQAPLLLLQGTTDDGVVPEQSLALLDALKKEGKTASYVAYTGEGHGFRQIGSVRDLYQRVERFFREHNGPSAGATD